MGSGAHSHILSHEKKGESTIYTTVEMYILWIYFYEPLQCNAYTFYTNFGMLIALYIGVNKK